MRGAKCSKSGNKYEKKIYNIVKNVYLNNKPFNRQYEKDLGGSSKRNDLVCLNGVGIEIKKSKTPDWMQCSLKYNNNRWCGSKNGKIPSESRDLFNKILNGLVLFNGKIPPFVDKKITYKEWLNIKNSCNDFNDMYIPIKNDTIKKMYKNKNCYYIQISDYGLYHLGEDIYNFNVPEFIIDQRLRIRTKVHSRKNKKGFCSLSVTAACQPVNIKSLEKSIYSLDTINKLPKNLLYENNRNIMDKVVVQLSNNFKRYKTRNLDLT